MTGEDIFRQLGGIDPVLAAAAAPDRPAKKRRWLPWAAAAACLVLILSLGLALRPPQPANPNAQPTDLPVGPMQYPTVPGIIEDWPYYQSPEEIAEAADYIFTGRVLSVSFAIFDMETGLEDADPQSQSTRRYLHTVYTVAVTRSHKGESPFLVRIRVLGGLPGYREQEQYALLQTAGLGEGIHIVNYGVGWYPCTLAPGGEYLLCTTMRNGSFDCDINPFQFAHYPASETAKEILAACNSSGG